MLTLTKFKRFLGVDSSNTDKDVVYQEFINDAIGEAERTTNRVLKFNTVKVHLNGNGTDTLILPEWPVYRVTKLQYFNGSDFVDIINSPDTIANSIRIINGYKIKFIKSYSFQCGVENIYLEFEAGYQFADEWVTGHAYLVGNNVVYNSQLYKCITAHTSGTFDVTKWELLTVELIPTDLEKAVKYNAAMIFYESPAGSGWFMKNSSNTGGQSSDGFTIGKDKMIDYYTRTYEAYRKRNIR
ncbi:MAG: hypothetical protein UZ05_CHB002000266 [Chlorobi bacterium OLB5]|nr:MAG: hypothetical protein UZ05_CHB002000266 [Chlorobi bacterium OLB5]